MNGVPTNYTLDVEGGLTQVLSDGTNGYLYGNGRLAEEQPGGWAYHLPDALGSVRQLTDAAGGVTLAHTFEPYGESLASSGAGDSAYGFTGEWTDGTGLVHLRARYYAPYLNRFLTADPSRLEANAYAYSLANPVNRRDPSGLVSLGLVGPEAFALCFDIHTGSLGVLAARRLGIPYVPAGLAVAICQAAYSNAAWLPLKWSFQLDGGLPTSAYDLFGRYVFETGRTSLIFDANQPHTREVAVSSIVQEIRNWYYRPGSTTNDPLQRYTGGDTSEAVLYPFETPAYARTLMRDSRNSWPSLPQFLGSFYYQVKTTREGRIGFRIDNDTTLESGTHIRGRFPYEEYQGSVEELIQQDPRRAIMPVGYIIGSSRTISILRPRTREHTGGFLGGGNMVQTFVWSERRDEPCAPYMYERNDPSLLDVDLWRDYRLYASDPLAGLPR